MGSAVIRERPGSIERVHEGSSLVENQRVPQPARHSRRTRGTAVSGRGPRPEHRIARVYRHGGRSENESTSANRHRDRGRSCHRRVENQGWSDERQQHRDAF